MDIVWNSTDFKYLYMQPPNDPSNPWNLNFYSQNVPANWIQVQSSNFSKQQIIRQQTVLAALLSNPIPPTDERSRWQLANIYFNRGSSKLVSNRNIKPLYLKAMYEQGLEEGITYWETRRSVGSLYSLSTDPADSATRGQQTLPGGIELDINVTMDVVEQFMVDHPEFIGHKRIYYNTRQDSTAQMNSDIQSIINAMPKYPNHILGWDLVGEEDAGNSLLYYLDTFLTLYDSSTGKSKIPLYLHNAETNWPDDLISSLNNMNKCGS